VTNNTQTQKSLKNALAIVKYRAQTQSLWTRQKQTANQSEAMTSCDVRTDNNRFTALAHRARAVAHGEYNYRDSILWEIPLFLCHHSL